MPRLFAFTHILVVSVCLLGAGVCALAEEVESPTQPPGYEEHNTTPQSAVPQQEQVPQPETAAQPTAADPGAPASDPAKVDFQHEDTYIDVSDAVRSKQYVHRAIITNLIRDTSRFYIPHFYVNHMMGFSSVWQRASNAYAKYLTGNQQLSLGYVTRYGHGLEVGAEFSNISNVYLGYRYFIRPKQFSLWGFVGGGYGFEVKSLRIADGPSEVERYSGPERMGFLTIGLLVPIVDIGIKAEIRMCFYDFQRVVFTQGVGIILFL